MSAKIIFPLSLIILPFILLLLPTPIKSASIKNDVSITTNTGGNRIDGEEDDKNIQTGSVNTKLNIENNLGSSTSSATSTTNIQIDTSLPANEEIRLTLDDAKFELIHRDGKAFLRTLNSDGEGVERELENAEKFSTHLDTGQIEIETAGHEFLLTHDGNKVVTAFPLIINTQTNTISANTEAGIQDLNLLPNNVYQLIRSEGLLNQITDVLELQLDGKQLAYTIEGTQTKKILGLFPFTTSQTISLAAQDGQVLKRSFKNRLQQILFSLSK